jgi:hypothetical protein
MLDVFIISFIETDTFHQTFNFKINKILKRANILNFLNHIKKSEAE